VRVDRHYSARTFFAFIPGDEIRWKDEESPPASPHRLDDRRWIG
jgi:hypothetical protein